MVHVRPFPDQFRAALPRFSVAAVLCVVAFGVSGIAVVLAGRDDDELARHSLVLMSQQMAVVHIWQWNTQGHFGSVYSANDNSSRTEVSGAMQTVSFRPASSGRGGSPFRSRRRNYTPGSDGGGRLGVWQLDEPAGHRTGRGKVLRCREFQHVESVVTAGQPAGRETCTQLRREAAPHRPIARAHGDHDLGPLARRKLDLAQLMRAGQQPAPRGAVQVLHGQSDRVRLAAGVSRHTAHAAQTGRWLVESASWRTLVAALLAQCLQ